MQYMQRRSAVSASEDTLMIQKVPPTWSQMSLVTLNHYGVKFHIAKVKGYINHLNYHENSTDPHPLLLIYILRPCVSHLKCLSHSSLGKSEKKNKKQNPNKLKSNSSPISYRKLFPITPLLWPL